MKVGCHITVLATLLLATINTFAQDTSDDVSIAIEEKLYYSVGLSLEFANMINSVRHSPADKKPDPDYLTGFGFQTAVSYMMPKKRFGVSLIGVTLQPANPEVSPKGEQRGRPVTAISVHGNADYITSIPFLPWLADGLGNLYFGATIKSTSLRYTHTEIDDTVLSGPGIRFGNLAIYDSDIVDTVIQVSADDASAIGWTSIGISFYF